MARDEPDTTSEMGAPGILHRRESLRKQLECPQCGSGRMPESKYCLRCGAKLPEIQREESPEVRARQRLRSRILIHFGLLLPGAFSPKVLCASLLMCAAGLVGGPTALFIMSEVGALGWAGAVFMFGLYLAVGFLSALAYLLGLSWLLSGEICNLREALAGFRAGHWILFLVLTSLGAIVVLMVL